MAEKKTKKTAQEKPAVTRAEKKDATKTLILEALKEGKIKSNELIDKASALYTQKFGDEGVDNPNDVKGRVGSVLDVMKKEGEVLFDGGMYALKAEEPTETPVEKPKKTTRKTAKKTEVKEEAKADEEIKEKPKAKRATKKATPLPAAPVQPIAPTAPITPDVAPEPIPEDKPKKRGRKPKAEKVLETPVATEIKEEIKEEPKPEPTPEKAEVKEETKLVPISENKAVAKTEVVDMSFLFGNIKPATKPVAPAKPAEKPVAEAKPMPEKAEMPAPVLAKPVLAPAPKAEQKKNEQPKKSVQSKGSGNKKPVRVLTADEKLQEAFLSRLRGLGGDYFEYYSVYLLERYSIRNGRRLEKLQITGGDHDGGIDGEIELTDRLGFRETIYIQSKNWNPDKGDEKLWVVGETLLQQFIGACVCRQAKDGKQHCRGIFMTTSRFTPEARKILNETSDKFVGYDGADIYETAKECEFGLVKKNGEWTLDEQLLSGTKAFFNMF